MTNAVDFSEFDSVQDIGAHQAGLVRIVLEGRSDVELFRRFWFTDRQDTFEFLEAGDLVKGSGCDAVLKAVSESTVPAVGILDRDSLFKRQRWPTLYTTDDAAFETETRDGQVYVTRFWEVEAYLLEPDLLSEWVGLGHVKPPGPLADCEAAVQRTLVECDILLTAAPFFAAKHAAGEACNPNHFRFDAHDQVAALCAQKLESVQDGHRAVAETVEQLVDQIRARGPADQAERLRYLLRFVDTKRLLARLESALQVRPDTHWIIAGLMFKSARRPEELEQILDSAAQLAAA